MDKHMDGRMDGQRENSIHPTPRPYKQRLRGYKKQK